jgi:hypothetical protein
MYDWTESNNFRNSYLNGSEIWLEVWFSCTLLITMKLLKTKQNFPICTWLMPFIRSSTEFSQWSYPVSELLPQKWLEESKDHVEYVRLIDYMNILYSQCNGILQRNTEQITLKTFKRVCRINLRFWFLTFCSVWIIPQSTIFL